MPRPSAFMRGGFALVVVAASGLAVAQQPAKPQRKAAPPVAGPEPVLPAASADQVSAAAMAFQGPYACEFNETVQVSASGKHAGYVEVRHGKMTWTMRPVLSSTGALRLEDVKGRMLMLQIPQKSMIMDTQAGRRIVDNCVHEKQRVAAPVPLGASLGIDPAKAAEAAQAAAGAQAAPTAPAAAASAASN